MMVFKGMNIFWKVQEVSSEDRKKANNAQALWRAQLHALKNSDCDHTVQKGKSGTMSSEGIQSSQTNDCRKYYVRCACYQLIIWPWLAGLSTNLVPRGANRAKGLQLPHSPRSPVSPNSLHQKQGRGRRKRGWREWADPLNILKEKTHGNGGIIQLSRSGHLCCLKCRLITAIWMLSASSFLKKGKKLNFLTLSCVFKSLPHASSFNAFSCYHIHLR